MSHDTKTLWLPGMAALAGAATLLIGTARLLPGSLWTDPRATLPMQALFLGSYLTLGALGAWWSRRAGGAGRARFAAGVFPLALHLSIFAIVVVAATAGSIRLGEHVQINFQLRALLVFIIIPGIALAIGTLPFLRDAATAGAPPGTADRLTRG